MMLKETRQKIENTFETKDIETFLIFLDRCSANKIGIPDLRAYVQNNRKIKTKK